MAQSKIVSITIQKKTEDVFDAILEILPKMLDAKLDDGWWSFTGPHGKTRLKFNENKLYGILDHTYIDEEVSWDVPMRVVPNGEYSKVIIALNKSSELSEKQFDQRVEMIKEMANNIKKIIES